MKKVFTFFLSIITMFSLVSCKNSGTTGLSSGTTALNTVEYRKTGSGEYFDDAEFLDKLSRFSNMMYEISSESENENYAVSPISMYMAISILHYIGDENVKHDIETLFGMTNEDIEKTGRLFLSLIKQKEFEGKVVSKLDLTNSIWFDNRVQGNKSVLDELAEKLFCYAYKTSFCDDNKKANEDIRQFIKEQTNGLIDNDFQLTQDTLFAIINTLYFKDIWDGNGVKLQKEIRKFLTSNGDVDKEFLLGEYVYGQVAETESCFYFYAKTESGYKIKFVLPKDGYSLKDVMTAENLNQVNSTKEYYKKGDEELHYTRCIFPKFKIESETNLKEVLQNNEYLTNAFSGFTTSLVEQAVQVSDVIHNVVINVDDEGVEGAAVTIITVKETSVNPLKATYHDFEINKNFGFIVTNFDDTILFEGQVVNP